MQRDLCPVYARHCDFLTVYIAEAHAEDEWPIRSARYNADRGPVRVRQPRRRADRVGLAQQFAADFGIRPPMQLAVDCPELGDAFEAAYAPWPLRFYVVEQATFQLIAQPQGCSYDLAVLADWLRGRFSGLQAGVQQPLGDHEGLA